MQWPPRQTIQRKIYKREINRVVKEPAQCVVKGMISKTASITCNIHQRKEVSWYLRNIFVMFTSMKQKRITMQRIVVREDFVKCAMGNIQLPGYIRKKVGNTQHQCNSEASEKRKDDEVAACASLNTGMEVISMYVVPEKLRHEDSGKTLKTYALGQLQPGYLHFREIPKQVWHKRKENINNHKNTQQ